MSSAEILPCMLCVNLCSSCSFQVFISFLCVYLMWRDWVGWIERQLCSMLVPASVGLSDVRPNGDQEFAGSIPAGSNNILQYLEIDLEIFSTVILSLLLIQEGHLSVSGNIMCTNTPSQEKCGQVN